MPNIMNIQQIKLQIGSQSNTQIGSLDMVRDTVIDPKDATKTVPTDWYYYWDNQARVRVVMHKDIFTALKANRELDGLAVKPPVTRTPAGKLPYKMFVIITPKIEASF